LFPFNPKGENTDQTEQEQTSNATHLVVERLELLLAGGLDWAHVEAGRPLRRGRRHRPGAAQPHPGRARAAEAAAPVRHSGGGGHRLKPNGSGSARPRRGHLSPAGVGGMRCVRTERGAKATGRQPNRASPGRRAPGRKSSERRLRGATAKGSRHRVAPLSGATASHGPDLL
jgi:hypothetical protein